MPRGVLLFCERDGSLPGAKSPLLSVGHAELFITDASGVEKSLGAVTDIRIDDPEDILRIPTYTPASPAELARRMTKEFGV